VLDASAVLALIHNEPGHEVVAVEIDGAVLGAANLAEVVGKLVDAEVDVSRLRELLSAAGVDHSLRPTRNWRERCADPGVPALAHGRRRRRPGPLPPARPPRERRSLAKLGERDRAAPVGFQMFQRGSLTRTFPRCWSR